MKDFEICWRLNSWSKSSESPNTYACPFSVCEKWDFTLSKPVYWRNRTHFVLPQRKQCLHPNGAPFDSQKVSGIWRWKIRSSFVPPAHRKFDATRYLDKTRYFIFRVSSFAILFKSSSKTLEIGSKRGQLPQNYSRFRPFPELWARSASDQLTNSQSCRKLRTAHLHWQRFCFLWRNKKK